MLQTTLARACLADYGLQAIRTFSLVLEEIETAILAANEYCDACRRLREGTPHVHDDNCSSPVSITRARYHAVGFATAVRRAEKALERLRANASLPTDLRDLLKAAWQRKRTHFAAITSVRNEVEHIEDDRRNPASLYNLSDDKLQVHSEHVLTPEQITPDWLESLREDLCEAVRATSKDPSINLLWSRRDQPACEPATRLPELS